MSRKRKCCEEELGWEDERPKWMKMRNWELPTTPYCIWLCQLAAKSAINDVITNKIVHKLCVDRGISELEERILEFLWK